MNPALFLGLAEEGALDRIAGALSHHASPRNGGEAEGHADRTGAAQAEQYGDFPTLQQLEGKRRTVSAVVAHYEGDAASNGDPGIERRGAESCSL